MSDKTLTCAECNLEFTFSAEDQRFHAEKGYTDPKRCPSCRAARRNSGGSSYGGGSYSSFGDSSYGGSSYRAPREMHPATCAQCGKETEVPFRPSGDRPVYCSDCFSKRPATSSSSSRRW
jgi:CxxC-x17-CxxC domain-containing protein